MKPRIAVLIPCYNEEIAISKVVNDFKIAVPDAVIYVYDNNSTDRTAKNALEAGALVRKEIQQGKGHVVRRMFRDIEADFYLMVDGDDTYESSLAPEMLKIAHNGYCDLVNCVRIETEDAAYRDGHRWGNTMLTGVVRVIFGNRVQDMLSGYKVFSRRFVKSFPALSQGFDIETELTVHALELTMPVAHVEGSYRGRPSGSVSKLRTYSDGWRILKMIFKLIRHERPMLFFSTIACILVLLSVVISIPVVLTYFQTGLVPRLPTAVLSTGIIILGALSFFAAIVLDIVSRGRKEVKLLAYLQHPPYPASDKSNISKTLH